MGPKILDNILFVARERLRDPYIDTDEEVAAAVAVHLGKALAAEADDTAGRSAGFYFDLDLTVEGRYLDRGAECEVGESDEKVIVEVAFLTFEEVVRKFLDLDDKVARDAAMRSGIALAGERQLDIVADAGRDVDSDDFLGADDTFAVAVVTLILDDASLAATVRADGLGLHLAKDGTLDLDDITGAIAVGAGLVGIAASAGAAAGLARDILVDLDFFFAALVDILEREFDLDTEIRAMHDGAALLTGGSAEAAEAAEATGSAEEVAEDIAELREDVVHVHTLTAEAALAVDAGMAELVVASLLVGVAEDIVGLGSLLEFFLGILVAGVTVGVIFEGQLTVGLFQIVGGGVLVDAENLIIIALSHK